MSRLSMLAVVVLLALASARDTLAARGTPYLDALAAALTTRAADAATPVPLRKLYAKHLKLLAKPTTTVKEDVATAAKIIPALEKKAAGDAPLMAAASSALDGFAASVTGMLIRLDADADALRSKSPLARIDRYLLSSHGAFSLSSSAQTLGSRAKLLRTAVLAALKAQKAIAKASGGDGSACGPSPTPAGLRALKPGESFTAHVIDNDRTYDFVAGSVTAKVGPQFDVPNGPTVLHIVAYDCTKQAATGFDVPYPPTIDQQYQSGPLASGLYRYVWDGFTGLVNFVSVKATAFDPAAKTITVEFSYGNVTQGALTLHDWQ